MSEERTFFRTCPECGRRFEVHLVSKSKVGEEDTVGGTPDGIVDEFNRMKPGDSHETDRPGWAVLQESVPTVVDAEGFLYKYRCNHCGHEWSEVHEKVTEGKAEGYPGD